MLIEKATRRKMISKCKNFKIRTKTKNKKRTIYYYCTLKRKEISFSHCRECDNKEYKKQVPISNKSLKKTLKNNGIKKKTSKLSKLERNRFSLFTDDLEHCIICGSTYQLTWHEIFGGKNRPNSMRYGLCLRICLSCHEKYQEDVNFNELWHKKGQAIFVKTYPNLDFVNIFKKNYL